MSLQLPKGLSKKEIVYLLVIYSIAGNNPISNAKIACELKLAKSTVSITVKRLVKKGFLKYVDKGIVKLTEKGRRVVHIILWKHGVLEVALTRLGFTPDEACKITSMIQHVFPDDAVAKLWCLCGRPCQCPHGFKFPTPNNPSFKDKRQYKVCGRL